MADLKLHIGCGDVHFDNAEGWINLDCRPMGASDVLYDMGKDNLPYSDSSVSEIQCIYTFEHIGPHKHEFCLTEWLRVLKPGGKVFLIVPDIKLMCQQAVNSADALVKGKEVIEEKSGVPADKAFEAAMVTIFSMDDGPGEPGRHRWGFTKQSLTNLMLKHGFVNVQEWGEQAPSIVSLSAEKPIPTIAESEL